MSKNVDTLSGAISGFPGYRLLEKLCSTQTSVVFRAFDEKKDRRIVLKVCKKAYPRPELIENYRKELALLQRMGGRGVVEAYEMIQVGPWLALVMEDIEGRTLEQILATGALTIAEFLDVSIRISEILGWIHHNRVIHKDLNPSNIIWNQETGQLKIIDLGISSTLHKAMPQYRQSTPLLGSLPYLSPEQTGRMSRAVDYRTDFYSLGASFYQMLTGKLPFEEKNTMGWIYAHIARNPLPPHERHESVPEGLSTVVMKLMAKNAEDRYQSAAGLKRDLVFCRQQWLNFGSIGPIIPGKGDVSPFLCIPEKLYGREEELDVLESSFENLGRWRPELVLITGYSGMGKTLLAHQLFKKVIERRGFFISCKFDINQAVPFVALTRALRSFFRELLMVERERIGHWRIVLNSRFGEHLAILTALIPELGRMLGKEPMEAGGDTESISRLIHLIPDLLALFASPEQPLVLFLDNLQWAGAASMNMITNLLVADSGYILVVGSCREDGLDRDMETCLDHMRKHEIGIKRLRLGPMRLQSVCSMLAETLAQPMEKVFPLARICLRKTKGNPFFLRQFLETIHRENMLFFDESKGTWTWNLDAVEGFSVTENVVTHLSGRVARLPALTRQLLMEASCFGVRFDLRILAEISDFNLDEVAAYLWDAVKEELIEPRGDLFQFIRLVSNDQELEELSEKISAPGDEVTELQCQFVHDRIQQLVYELMSPEHRLQFHLRIGRYLWHKTNQYFEVVNHLNLAAGLMEDRNERRRLAELNLRVGRELQEEGIYRNAHDFFRHGLSLLDAGAWDHSYELTLNLALETMAAAGRRGNFEEMEHLMAETLKHCHNPEGGVRLAEIQLEANISQNRMREALQTGLNALEILGFSISTGAGTQSRVVRWWRGLFPVQINAEKVRHLSLNHDPKTVAAARIIGNLYIIASLTAPELFPLLVQTHLRILLYQGICPSAPLALTNYAMLLCTSPSFEFEKASHLCDQAMQIAETNGVPEVKLRTGFFSLLMVQHWIQPIPEMLMPLRKLYQTFLEKGDYEFAGYTATAHSYLQLMVGTSLNQVASELDQFSEQIERVYQATSLNYLNINRQALAILIHGPQFRGKLSGSFYNERSMVPLHEKAGDLMALCLLNTRKLMIATFFGDWKDALKVARKSRKYLGVMKCIPEYGALIFYESLALLAQQRTEVGLKSKLLKENRELLRLWSEHCPQNFSHRYELILAEEAAANGRLQEAMGHYDSAIERARENGFPHEEALALELASSFFLHLGRGIIAHSYIREAHYKYLLWGADAKVHMLEEKFPSLANPMAESRAPKPGPWSAVGEAPDRSPIVTTSEEGSPISLDLATVTEATLAIAREINRRRLLTRFMTIIQENAGAEKCFLIMDSKTELCICASSCGDQVQVMQRIPIHNCDLLSATIVRYSVRNRETVLLNDAKNDEKFSSDSYLKNHNVKSVMCTPLIQGNRLMGILYLENNLTTNAFLPDRLVVLQILLGQMTISLAHSQIYEELEDRVTERTEDLSQANQRLVREIEERKQAQKDLESLQEELVQTAHRAGMARVATEMLHNVGNVLNSINISCEQIDESLDNFAIEKLLKANELLQNNKTDIQSFLTNHPQGKFLPDFYSALGHEMEKSYGTFRDEFGRLQVGVKKIINLLASQKEYVGGVNSIQEVDLALVIDETLELNSRKAESTSMIVKRDYAVLPIVKGNKDKLIDVFMGLFRNAGEAMVGLPEKEKILNISLGCKADQAVICLRDCGVGIPLKHQKLVFSQGFTTKKEGHGFGLHKCANLVNEMGGLIELTSPGTGLGTSVTIFLPLATKPLRSQPEISGN